MFFKRQLRFQPWETCCTQQKYKGQHAQPNRSASCRVTEPWPEVAGPAGLLCSCDPKLAHHIWVWGNTESKEATRRPRGYSQRTGWDKFSETFGFVLWHRVPLTQSHHCVQKGESIEESHTLLPYREWDRSPLWLGENIPTAG